MVVVVDVVLVVVEVDVVAGRGLVVVVDVGRVVDGVGNPLLGAAGSAVVAGPVVAGRDCEATAYQRISCGSMVVVVVADVAATDGRVLVVVDRSTWTPRTSGAATARSSRSLFTPTTMRTPTITRSSAFSTRSSGVWKRSLLRMRLMLLVSLSGGDARVQDPEYQMARKIRIHP